MLASFLETGGLKGNIMAGQDWGFIQFYRRNRLSLQRYFARMISNPADVDELVNETFTRIYASSSTEKTVPPRSYLFVAAHNIAVNHYRKQHNRREQAIADDAEAIADTAPSVERHLIGRQSVEVLWEAVNSLPPRQREVFILRKVQNLSNKAIAQQLSITVSAVEKHIKLGLRNCHDFMKNRECHEFGPEMSQIEKGGATHGSDR